MNAENNVTFRGPYFLIAIEMGYSDKPKDMLAEFINQFKYDEFHSGKAKRQDL
tara:strand:- start:273 stop:431 length:159 start_codon:yes stop_codon:yes gene_type:complete